MDKKEYFARLNKVKIDNKKTNIMQSMYGTELPVIIKKLISSNKETIFFDDGTRILAFAEIIDSEKDLHIEFKNKGLIPLIDCGDNDFIVYNFNENNYSIFNIVDEVSFKKRNDLKELLL